MTGQRRGGIPLAGDGTPATRHGLSSGAVAVMRARQGGRCAVCRRPLAGDEAIDHDHELAARHGHAVSRGCARCVRALLCRSCNLMLGYARDDARVLRAGAEYLEVWRARGRR